MTGEKFLRKKERELKQSMEAALNEKNRQLCKVAGCVGTAMSSTGYCPHHWNEELARRKDEEEKNRRERAKQDPKEIARGQALAFYFQGHRECGICGRVGLTYETGKAIHDPRIPDKKRKRVQDGIITLCNDCLAEFEKKKK